MSSDRVSWLDTVESPKRNEAEWVHTCPHSSSPWRGALPCNLDTKWSPAGHRPKQNWHFDFVPLIHLISLYTRLSWLLLLHSCRLVFLFIILNWNLLHFLFFIPSFYPIEICLVFLYGLLMTCICWKVIPCAVDVIQYYKQCIWQYYGDDVRFTSFISLAFVLNKKNWFDRFISQKMQLRTQKIVDKICYTAFHKVFFFSYS